MRQALLDILRCPGCEKAAFKLQEGKRDKVELVEGEIFCGHCNISYKVKDGIVNFLNNASSSVIRERQAMNEEETKKNLERMARFRARFEGREATPPPGQPIPMYRLMKKTELKGTLAEPFNAHDRRRYVK